MFSTHLVNTAGQHFRPDEVPLLSTPTLTMSSRGAAPIRATRGHTVLSIALPDTAPKAEVNGTCKSVDAITQVGESVFVIVKELAEK